MKSNITKMHGQQHIKKKLISNLPKPLDPENSAMDVVKGPG